MINEEIGLGDRVAMAAGKGVEQTLHLRGFYRLELRGPDGQIKEFREGENTVTSAGKAGVADQILASPTLSKMGWLAIGTGSPAATLLGSENARVAFTSKTRNTNVVTVVGDFPAGTGTGAITE